MMTKRDKWFSKACPWFFGAVCVVTSLALFGRKDAGGRKGRLHVRRFHLPEPVWRLLPVGRTD